MSNKFTPGPWHVETQKGFSENRFLIFDEPDEKGEMDRVACTCFAEHETSLANAHLIAAAPDMYKMLNWLYNNFDNSTDPEMVEIAWQIEPILKKTRGEE